MTKNEGEKMPGEKKPSGDKTHKKHKPENRPEKGNA